MKEAYCSYGVSELLKKKGFDEECTHYYDLDDGTEYTNGARVRNSRTETYCTSPTHQMAMKWLREIHHIFIEISTSIDLNCNYHFNYGVLDKECKYVRRGYTDFDWNYEDAVEAALKYCLEKLIK